MSQITGHSSSLALKLPSENMSELFKMTDEGNVIIRNEAFANFVAEANRIHQSMATRPQYFGACLGGMLREVEIQVEPPQGAAWEMTRPLPRQESRGSLFREQEEVC